MTGPASAPDRAAAFFDVDGTIVHTTIVHYYAYFRLRGRAPLAAALWQTLFLCRCLGYLLLDKIDRSWFNVFFYRNYGGMNAEATRALAGECYRAVMRPRMFGDAARCIHEHHNNGIRVVLVTGSIDFLIAPLARELGVDDVIAPKLIEREGRFTGELDGPPIGNGEKADRVRAFAATHGIDLDTSFAYGDSIADLPMLESVGRPAAVNPDRALRALAQRRGWDVHAWQVGDCPGGAC